MSLQVCRFVITGVVRAPSVTSVRIKDCLIQGCGGMPGAAGAPYPGFWMVQARVWCVVP